MTDQWQTQGFEIQRQLQRQIDALDNDPALTPFGRMQRANELREAARPQLDALREAKNQAAAARRKSLEDNLFGRSFSEGTDPATIMSYRDAARVVAGLDGVNAPAEAERMMRSAIQIGDVALQKILLRTAYDNGWVPTINIWADANPNRDADINELWDIRNESDRGRAQLFDGLGDMSAFTVDQSPQSAAIPPQAVAAMTNRQNEQRQIAIAQSELASILNPETPVDSTTGTDGGAA